MPIILRNKTATIEIDRNVSLQHIVTKGSFDVTIHKDSDDNTLVCLAFIKRDGQVRDNIDLDWRDISEPEVGSATELRDLILGWNIVPAIISTADSASVTAVSSSASNVRLLDANASRRMACIYNNSTADLYVKFGEVASQNSFTKKLATGGYLEMPSPCYTGIIEGIWSEANGNAMITEIT